MKADAPPVYDRLHKFGAYRIEQTVQACEDLPHSHVTPGLLLALFDRETLLQNIIGAGDDDTGQAGVPRHDRLQVAVASYNAGMGGALKGWREGHVDKYTAAPRHDYSKDVIGTRKPQIDDWLRENGYIGG
jgi:hypothetical protein